MAAAGAIHVERLKLLAAQDPRRASRPPSSTRRPRSFIRSQGAEPAFKGYRGFPGSICASPNSWSSTASPGPTSSSAATSSPSTSASSRTAGSPTARARSRSAPVTPVAAQAARGHARRRCSPPSSSAAPATASATSRTPCRRASRRDGLSVVRSLVGHGIGRDMHEDPQIPNYGEPGRGPVLEEGMVLADRADGHRRPPRRADGRRRLGDLLPGRLAGRPLRVHGRHHRRRPADPHAVARASRL